MPELVISNAQEINKLEGWRVESAELQVLQQGNAKITSLLVKISHVAAEKQVMLRITPSIELIISGNTVVAGSGLYLQTTDV